MTPSQKKNTVEWRDCLTPSAQGKGMHAQIFELKFKQIIWPVQQLLDSGAWTGELTAVLHTNKRSWPRYVHMHTATDPYKLKETQALISSRQSCHLEQEQYMRHNKSAAMKRINPTSYNELGNQLHERTKPD